MSDPSGHPFLLLVQGIHLACQSHVKHNSSQWWRNTLFEIVYFQNLTIFHCLPSKLTIVDTLNTMHHKDISTNGNQQEVGGARGRGRLSPTTYRHPLSLLTPLPALRWPISVTSVHLLRWGSKRSTLDRDATPSLPPTAYTWLCQSHAWGRVQGGC